MGFLDKAKSLVKKHEDTIDQGLEKAGDLVDKRTKGKHGSTIDKVVDKAQDLTPDSGRGRAAGSDRPPSSERP